jgi:hypothetical protein
MRRFCLLFIAAVLWASSLDAQYVDYGQDPSHLRWRQILTEHYRLIYPALAEMRAQVYATLLETVYAPVRATMSSRRAPRMNVVLHPTTSYENGLVAWAPQRMELLTAPTFRSQFQLAELGLSLHESRHVAQLDQLNSGVFRPLTALLGEHVMGVAAAVAPQWLLEGEAVTAETALSSSGRGRIATFTLPYTTQMATGKNFSFDKWLLGSYRDNTSDFYALGYVMTAYARKRYGAGVWSRTLARLSRLPVFAVALKTTVGTTSKRLFADAFADLQAEQRRLQPASPDSPQILSPENRRYTSYLYPQATADGRIVSLKQSLDDNPAIVSVDSAGHEQRLAYTGDVNSKLTCSDGYVYWSEYVGGLRWTHENWSVVRRLDLATGKVSAVSRRRARYWLPTPLHGKDSGKIAVFEYTPSGAHNIVVLDATGKVERTLPTFRNLPLQDIVADTRGNLFASLVGRGQGIFRLNLDSGDWQGLLSYRRTNIEALRLHGRRLLFESGCNGISNIYALDTLTLKVQRLTAARFGAFSGDISADGRQLLFADYSARGARLASLPMDSLKPASVDFRDIYRFELAEAVSAQETFNIDDTAFSIVPRPSRPYSKSLHLFRVHSWLPLFYDIDAMRQSSKFELTPFRPGVTLLSQNALNTMTSQFSYYYDFSSHANHGFVSLRYSGWLPVLELKTDIGGQRQYLGEQSTVSSSAVACRVQVGAYVPLNFSAGNRAQGLQPFFNWYYTNALIDAIGQNFQYFNGGVYYYRYRRLAHRDLYPRSGVRLWLAYAGQPYLDMGQLLTARTVVYLPGVVRPHSLRLTVAAQHQFFDVGERPALYFPSQYIDLARGANYDVTNRYLYTLKADYAFPIACPDLPVGWLMYLSRIRADIFADCTNSFSRVAALRYSRTTQSAYGLELLADVHFLRLRYAPATLQVQFLKPSGRKPVFTFAAGITIN